jgi:phytoene dehydrogenase-like protein
MSRNKALIIGGGVAGLCAGVYLCRNGFETEILEMHTQAGGLATSWTRRGYTFENCVHWLVGSRPGSAMNALWREVFDIDRLRFYDGEVYQVIERDGRRLSVYKNVDRMEQEFLDKAPEDAIAIRDFARLVRKLAGFRIPGGSGPFARAASAATLLPCLPGLVRCRNETLGTYSERFRNPLIREFFTSGLSRLSFLAIAFSLGWMASGDAA